MTGATDGRDFSTPVIDMDAAIAKAERNKAALVAALRRLPLLPGKEGELPRVAARYATLSFSKRTPRTKLEPTVHSLARRIETFMGAADAVIAASGQRGRTTKRLRQAASQLFPDGAQAMPGAALMAAVISSSEDPATITEMARRIRDSAAETLSLVPPPEHRAGSGRPENVAEYAVALMLARDFEMLTGRAAGVVWRWDKGRHEGPFIEVLELVLRLNGSTKTASALARRIMADRKKRDGF